MASQLIIPSVYIYSQCAVAFFKDEVMDEIKRTGGKDDNNLFLKVRAFQCLHNIWHSNFRHGFQIGCTFVSKWAASLALYCVIRFQDLTAVKIVCGGVLFYLCLCANFNYFGSLYETSGDAFQKWKEVIIHRRRGSFNKDSKWMLKRLCAVTSVKTHVGIFFSITSESLLELLNDVVDSTVTLLFL